MLRLRRVRIGSWKNIFMSFLLHLHEDLDDDLLFDAIGLLVDE